MKKFHCSQAECRKAKTCCFNPRLYPTLPVVFATICFALNCFPLTSGLGTILSGVYAVSCCFQRDSQPGLCIRCIDFGKVLLLGLAQLVTAIILIGWLWSICTGWKLYRRAKK